VVHFFLLFTRSLTEASFGLHPWSVLTKYKSFIDLPRMPPHSEVVKRNGGYISVIVKSKEDLTTLLED